MVPGEVPPVTDPRIPAAFPHLAGAEKVVLQTAEGSAVAADGAADRALNVGVVLSGGQAPGRTFGRRSLMIPWQSWILLAQRL